MIENEDLMDETTLNKMSKTKLIELIMKNKQHSTIQSNLRQEIKEDLTNELKNQSDELKKTFVDLVNSKIKELESDFSLRIEALEKELETEVFNLKKHIQKQEEQITKLQNLSKTQVETAQKPHKTEVDMYQEYELRMNKKNNLIIFNLQETKDEEADVTLIQNIITNTLELNLKPKMIQRLGKKLESKTRPVLLKCESQNDKVKILRNCNKLKNSQFRNISVKPDMTKTQQAEEKLLIEELKRRKLNGEDVMIQKGKVILRPQIQD